MPNLTALENVELAAQVCRDSLDAAQTLEKVGLGARKLSMSSGNIAGVKAKLSECTLQELTALAEKKL